MSAPVSHVVLRKSAVKRDWKLALSVKNNGRKVLVTERWPGTEIPITDPAWRAGPKPPKPGGTPVLETGRGGIEVATATERAGQERHMHRLGTEIYTVLEGELRIALNDEPPIRLRAGDEVIILPGTIHEIVPSPARSGAKHPRLLVRVHAVACHGDRDKYVQLRRGGKWIAWHRVPVEQRAAVYRKYTA